MSKLKSFGAAALALLAALGAADPNQFLPFVPLEYRHWVPVVLSACAAIVHFFNGLSQVATPAAGDAKTSIQKLTPLLLIATAVFTSMTMTSCGSVPWTVTTPYGNLSNSKETGTVYTPPEEPIHLHSGK